MFPSIRMRSQVVLIMNNHDLGDSSLLRLRSEVEDDFFDLSRSRFSCLMHLPATRPTK